MASVVDRYTPAEPFPRMVVALVASSVPLTLFVFGLSVLINRPSPVVAMRGVPGLALAVLFVSMLAGLHVAHVLAGDVARRAATGTDRSTTEQSRTAVADEASGDDPLTVLERRYAAGELDDDEFGRRRARLRGDESSDETVADRPLEPADE